MKVAIQAIDQQKTTLLSLLKKLGTTPYAIGLGLGDIPKTTSLDELQQAFVDKTPVVNYPTLVKQLESMRPALKGLDVFMADSPLLAETVAAFAPDSDGHLIPVSSGLLKAFQSTERDLLTAYRKQWPEIGKGTWFYICDDAMVEHYNKHATADLFTLQMEQKSLLSQRAVAPDLLGVQAVGRSRSQALLVYADELQKHGKDVHTIVASARTLSDLCFLLAQREGKFIPLQALCPNVKLFLFTDDPSTHIRELQYFFSGLEIPMASFIARPYGLVAWQADLNQRSVMALPLENNLYYEFIPTTDIDASGRLKKDYKRLHIGQAVPGRDYALVVTTSLGLIAYQTGDIVQIVDKEPVTFKWMRYQQALNGFGEYLIEDAICNLVESFNNALVPYGFFIRDFMVGDRATDRCPHWVIEISRQPKDLPEKVLQSVTNRLHRELAKDLPTYMAAFSHNRTFPPSMHFVPMGAFTNMPSPFEHTRLDHTEEAERLEQVLKRVGEQAVTLRGPLL